MSTSVAGISVLDGLLTQVSIYISRRIPSKMRSRVDVEDILQEIARTILRTTLHRSSTLSPQDWERMIWIVVRRQLRKQLRFASSPEDKASVQLNESCHVVCPVAMKEGVDACIALDELLIILDNCTERQRRFVHFRLEGLSNSDIARLEGVNEGSVRRQLLKVEQAYLGSTP